MRRNDRPPPDRPTDRLSAEAARRIADGAVAGLPMADLLAANGREMADGRLVWRFRTPTRGSGIEVDVDDASGEATVRQWHGR